MSSGQVSQEEVERTKQQIRGLVSEIAELSKSELGPDEYYAAFLQRIVSALAAVGGAVWTLGDGRKPQVAYQINVAESLLDQESEDAIRHRKLMELLVQGKQPQLIPPNSGDETAGNPTRQLLVVAPLGHDDQVEGLVEIFQRPEAAPATQRGYLRFLVQMCEVAADWFKNRKVKHLSDRHSLWTQADEFTRAVHETLDQRETCYTVVNEGRRLLGVDRVSLALMRGTKCVVEAISGQDTIEARSNVVVNLGKLATKVCAAGEALWYTGSSEDLPPQIEEVIHDYVDESHTRSMAILPLRRPRPRDDGPAQEREGSAPLGEILGALIIEQIESDIPQEVLNPRLELVFEHSQRALTNVIDYNSLFLMPVWRTLGKMTWVLKARTLPKTIAIVSAIATLLFLSWVIPWNFDMNAKGELQPVLRRDVFAQEEGIVRELSKNTGDEVQTGEVICRIDNPKLSTELARIRGELDSATESLASVTRMLSASGTKGPNEAADRLNLLRQQGEMRIKVDSFEKQLEIIKGQMANLEVKSPVAGRIVTWDLERQLKNRPVQPGQVLFTVANDTKGWELELFMKQSRIGHVNEYRGELKKQGEDLDVDYIVMTDPGTRHTGKVKAIDSTSFQHETEGHVVKMRVSVDKPESLVHPLPGTTVTAKVHCGRTSIGWYWLHEAWEYAESNLLFW